MKKLFTLATIAALLIACGPVENVTPEEQVKPDFDYGIVGKWRATYDYEVVEGPNTASYKYGENECIFNFREDGIMEVRTTWAGVPLPDGLHKYDNYPYSDPVLKYTKIEYDSGWHEYAMIGTIVIFGETQTCTIKKEMVAGRPTGEILLYIGFQNKVRRGQNIADGWIVLNKVKE